MRRKIWERMKRGGKDTAVEIGGPYMQIGSLAKKCIKYDLGGEKDEKGNNHRVKKLCRDPGSNRGPLDLQSNALPTELSRLLLDKRVCHTKTTSPQNLREICPPRLYYIRETATPDAASRQGRSHLLCFPSSLGRQSFFLSSRRRRKRKEKVGSSSFRCFARKKKKKERDNKS